MGRFHGLRVMDGETLIGFVESVTLYDSSGYVLCIIRTMGERTESWVHNSQLVIS